MAALTCAPDKAFLLELAAFKSLSPASLLSPAPQGLCPKERTQRDHNLIMDLRKWIELELELIHTQMTQKPMLRAEVGMRVRCANKASAECIMRGRGIGQNSRKNCKKRGICG